MDVLKAIAAEQNCSFTFARLSSCGILNEQRSAFDSHSVVYGVQRSDGYTARLARRSDEALGVRVSVARIAPSFLDLDASDWNLGVFGSAQNRRKRAVCAESLSAPRATVTIMPPGVFNYSSGATTASERYVRTWCRCKLRPQLISAVPRSFPQSTIQILPRSSANELNASVHVKARRFQPVSAALVERLPHSPPTPANLVHIPAGSLPDFRSYPIPPSPNLFIQELLHTYFSNPHRLSRPRLSSLHLQPVRNLLVVEDLQELARQGTHRKLWLQTKFIAELPTTTDPLASLSRVVFNCKAGILHHSAANSAVPLSSKIEHCIVSTVYRIILFVTQITYILAHRPFSFVYTDRSRLTRVPQKLYMMSQRSPIIVKHIWRACFRNATFEESPQGVIANRQIGRVGQATECLQSAKLFDAEALIVKCPLAGERCVLRLHHLDGNVTVAPCSMTMASLTGQIWPYRAHPHSRDTRVLGESKWGTGKIFLALESRWRISDQTNHLPPRRTGLDSRRGRCPSFSHVGIVPYDAASRRVSSGISRPRPFYFRRCSALALASPSSALKTSVVRAAQISSLTHSLDSSNIHAHKHISTSVSIDSCHPFRS
ncbi:hypothetical protein PR048_028751 [Dryococelus australis]|uniref:Uncharacterized protein n=1 Tax=Dryococelus australis TaxID=614101 RepID=A0ABQ9GE71_9NEOP|nr:hypothetical protein PR048_028751 [Dryococelus australis]